MVRGIALETLKIDAERRPLGAGARKPINHPLRVGKHDADTLVFRPAAVDAVPKPLINPNLAKIYRRKVVDLHLALESEELRPEAFEIIRSLIDEIVLTPEDGELRIDLKGNLAAIPTLSEGSKKPATELRGGLAQLKVVAGAGFDLYRTFLVWVRQGRRVRVTTVLRSRHQPVSR